MKKEYKHKLTGGYNGEITEEMVEFVKKMVRAKHCVRPVTNCELEDLEQLALEETVKYIGRYDPNKSPLEGYLALIVASTLRNANRYSTKPHRWSGQSDVSYEEFMSPDDGSSSVEEEGMFYMERNFDKIGFKTDLFFYASLSPFESKIVQLLYIETPKIKIARKLGISMNMLQGHIDLIGCKYLMGTLFYRYKTEYSE